MYDLTIPTTFASMLADTGRQGTYVPPGADTWCRNDYVLVSASVFVYHASVASWQDVDIGHKRKDHYPGPLLWLFASDVHGRPLASPTPAMQL